MVTKKYSSKVGMLVVAVVVIGIGYLLVSKNSVKPMVEPGGETANNGTPQTSSQAKAPSAPVLTSIAPAYGPLDTRITLRGMKFSPTGNTVVLRAKDTSIFPWYVLKAHNIASSANGTSLVITINAGNFLYGECSVGQTSCNGSVKKIETGEYSVSVQPKGCDSKSCESNAVKYIVTAY